MTHFGGRKKGVFLYQNLLLHNCFQISVVLIIQIFNKKKDFLSKIHRTLDQKKNNKTVCSNEHTPHD